jgi:hypothetical protein
MNVGVLLGDASGGLVDVDLDCAEARSFADEFLPPTGCVFGRAGNPRSHRIYICDPVPRTTPFKDTNEGSGGSLVEIRADGVQTVFPPSMHPSGELVRFDADGEPSRVDGPTLARQVAKLAAACLLARYWPQTAGSRQDIANALAGGLHRAKWAEEEVTDFIGAVARAAGDDEATARAKAGYYTFKRLDAAGPATGWPRLAALIGQDVVDNLRSWIDPRSSDRVSPSAASSQQSVIQEGHEGQRSSEVQGDTDLSVGAVACSPPVLDGPDTGRMKQARADIDARRPPTLPLHDHIAAAVEWHARWQRAGDNQKWTPLWAFIRMLRGHPALHNLGERAACDLVEAVLTSWPDGIGNDAWGRWTGIAAKDARMEFIHAWPLVKYAAGHGPPDAAKERAGASPLPVPPEHRDSDELVELLSIAGWLQVISGDRDIFLSCSVIGKLVGVIEMTAWRLRERAYLYGYFILKRRGQRGSGGGFRRGDELRFAVDRFPMLMNAMPPRAPAGQSGPGEAWEGPRAA